MIDVIIHNIDKYIGILKERIVLFINAKCPEFTCILGDFNLFIQLSLGHYC